MKLNDHEQVVLKAIEHVAGSRNGLASVPAVTRAVGFPISTTQKILAALHRREIIALHHHDFPAQMTADEKKRAVKIGNDYFHAVAIRNPAMGESVNVEKLPKAQRAAIEDLIERVNKRGGWIKLTHGTRGKVIVETEYGTAARDKQGKSTSINPAGNMKRGAAKSNPSPAQLKARAAFTRMAKARAKAAKKANPRARNKAATVSAADIAKMPAHVQAKLRGDLAKVEAKEAKATTPTQKAAAVKARRSFLSRLGTRLRVIGQTKKFKVSARNLNKAPRKTIKIRARHETDAIAKAQAKLGGGFDQFKVQNTVRHRVGNPTFTITATEKGVHLGSFQDKTKTAALKRAKQAYGHRYAGIKATAKNPKRRNGIAKTAGKAIKKVTRAVLGGVSKVAGKGAKALKNPAIPKNAAEYKKLESKYHAALYKSGRPTLETNAMRDAMNRYERIQRDLTEAKARQRYERMMGNPSASAIRKKFAGRVSGQKTLYFPKGAPLGLAKLGRLVSIKLKGGKLIKPSRRNPSAEIWLCSDTSGKLWLGCTKAGPLYAGAPGDLGEMSMLEYSESKPHIGYPAQTIWFHKMGEVSGRRPHLIVNDDQDLLIKGGNYKITRAGIVD